MELSRVSTFTLQKFRQAIIDKGRAVATANRVVATWNHRDSWLYDNGKIAAPLPRMKSVKENNRLDFFFSASAETATLDTATRDVNSRVWQFMKIGFGTLMRHSEILSARYDHLDVARRRLRVKVKGGRWRDRPLPQWLVDLLIEDRESADDPDGWIFPSKQTRTGHVNQLGDQFRRCAIAAGLNPARATPHAMRYTAVTRFSAAISDDAAMAQRRSGHLSVQMVLRYTHPFDDHVNDALDRMDGSNVVLLRKVRKS